MFLHSAVLWLLVFPQMSVPKWNFLFQAEKINFVLDRTELLYLLFQSQKEMTKISLPWSKLNMIFLFLWFSSRSPSWKDLRMLKTVALPLLWMYLSLHYLNTFMWTAIKYCIAWKLFTLIFLIIYNTLSMMCIGLMLHNIVSFLTM